MSTETIAGASLSCLLVTNPLEKAEVSHCSQLCFLVLLLSSQLLSLLII